MRALFADDYFDVQLDEPRAVVRVRRLPKPYENIDGATEAMQSMLAALPKADRSRLGLIVDLRDAPARNDPQFEQAVNGLVRPALVGFRAQATIVRTAAGRLQMQRMSRDVGRGMVVFTSEDEALRHVLSPAPV